MACFEIAGHLGRGVGRSPTCRPVPFPLSLGAAAGVPNVREKEAQPFSTWPEVNGGFARPRGFVSHGRQAGETNARARSSWV